MSARELAKLSNEVATVMLLKLEPDEVPPGQRPVFTYVVQISLQRPIQPQDVRSIWWLINDVMRQVPEGSDVVLSGAGPIWMYIELVRMLAANYPKNEVYVLDPKLRAAVNVRDIRRRILFSDETIALLSQVR